MADGAWNARDAAEELYRFFADHFGVRGGVAVFSLRTALDRAYKAGEAAARAAPTVQPARARLPQRLVVGESKPDDQGWRASTEPCVSCGAAAIIFRVVGDHADIHWRCTGCGTEGWIDGPDA